MKQNHSPITQAMQSQLSMMEHFLHNMLDNVTEAQGYLDQHNRNAAMGTLLASGDSFKAIRSLYETLMIMHQNAALIEHNDNK